MMMMSKIGGDPAQWAKKGLAQKFTIKLNLRYWYDFEMFTKWNHTSILENLNRILLE